MEEVVSTVQQHKPRRRFNFRGTLSIPYFVFMLIFVVFPLSLIFFYAFTNERGMFTFANWGTVLGNAKNWAVIGQTFLISTISTIICILVAYPIAYLLSNKKYNKNKVLVYIFLLPMWINFVLRTGATRDLLTWMGINGGNMPYLATLIGMVQNYLPFVILPLYTTMLKLDKSQIEAAADLGANPVQVFFKSVVPQSVPGIVSACTMTFMPTMSSYVISDTLSEGKITLFGNYIYLDFANNLWHDGSFMALIMLVIIGISMILTRNSGKEEKEGGAAW